MCPERMCCVSTRTIHRPPVTRATDTSGRGTRIHDGAAPLHVRASERRVAGRARGHHASARGHHVSARGHHVSAHVGIMQARVGIMQARVGIMQVRTWASFKCAPGCVRAASARLSVQSMAASCSPTAAYCGHIIYNSGNVSVCDGMMPPRERAYVRASVSMHSNVNQLGGCGP